MSTPQTAYILNTVGLIVAWYEVYKALPKLFRVITAPAIPVAVWVWNFQLRKDFRILGLE